VFLFHDPPSCRLATLRDDDINEVTLADDLSATTEGEGALRKQQKHCAN
jgi:hypothetical protein